MSFEQIAVTMWIVLMVGMAAFFVHLLVKAHRRRSALAREAPRRGWDYRAKDPGLLATLTDPWFPHLHRRRRVSVSNVIRGHAHGRAFVAFDYVWSKTNTSHHRSDSGGPTRYDMVMIPLERPCPVLMVARAGLLGEAMGWLTGGEIDIDRPDFDHDFQVRADSEPFARAALQPATTDWLLEHSDKYVTWRTSGDDLLLWWQLSPTESCEDVARRVDFAHRVAGFVEAVAPTR